ncbi:MAG: alanyl-tRNA editing protein [Clostridia bacterium]|nr:alanyl-tRNA editing protein [Clostridia bacterium]
MTERLYYQDAFLASFDAVVVACDKARRGYTIELDRTAFFPEGGGQGGDRGTLDGVPVLDTKEEEGRILHYTEAALPVGKTVHGAVDFALRFRRMQCHSGEHLFSGLAHDLYGAENVGFHLGEHEMTVDTSRPLSPTELADIEARANAAVAKDLPIRVFFPTEEEAAALPYRSKIEITKDLRLVEIPGYDLCACCAPHVRTTGQIGLVKVLDTEAHKGGMRIHLLCGGAAVDDYGARYRTDAALSALLSAPQDKLCDAVRRLLTENEALRAAATDADRHLAEVLFAGALRQGQNLLFFDEKLGKAGIKRLSDLALPACRICGIFVGRDGGYQYTVLSEKVDLAAIADDMNALLCGRGGKNRTMLCGKCTATRAQIEQYFSDL